MNSKQISLSLWIILLLAVSCKHRESQYLSAVKTFADNAIEKGKDRWSGKNTPLLADGINIQTGEPLEYVYDGSVGVRGEGGQPDKWIIHNLASQQNFFRVLVGLTNLTGDQKYR